MNSPSSTRDRVLEYIKRNGPVSVKKLTEEIGITPMAIRGHLGKLEKEELIQVGQVRQKLGRPLQVFSLTDKGESCFPKNYDSFALELLEDIKNLDAGKTLEKVVQKRELRLIEELRQVLSEATSPRQKLDLYCQFIERQGNMPSIETLDPKSYMLHVANCSISSITSQYSFPCETEIRVIKSVFPEAKVRRVQSIADEAQGCAYHFEF